MMKMRIACLAAVAIVSLYCVTASVGQGSDESPRVSVDRGAAIFRKSCSVCHSTHEGEVKVGPSLFGVLREKSGHSEQQIRHVITEGQNSMPPFNEKLDSEQMKDLVAYLKTL